MRLTLEGGGRVELKCNSQKGKRKALDINGVLRHEAQLERKVPFTFLFFRVAYIGYKRHNAQLQEFAEIRRKVRDGVVGWKINFFLTLKIPFSQFLPG